MQRHRTYVHIQNAHAHKTFNNRLSDWISYYKKKKKEKKDILPLKCDVNILFFLETLFTHFFHHIFFFFRFVFLLFGAVLFIQYTVFIETHGIQIDSIYYILYCYIWYTLYKFIYRTIMKYFGERGERNRNYMTPLNISKMVKAQGIKRYHNPVIWRLLTKYLI